MTGKEKEREGTRIRGVYLPIFLLLYAAKKSWQSLETEFSKSNFEKPFSVLCITNFIFKEVKQYYCVLGFT